MAAKKLPVQEIAFAARLGFLPKALWWDFFAKGNPRWRRRCWLNLWRSGAFKKHRNVPDVLVLESKHLLVGEVAPSISAPPNVRQFFHDEIVGRSSLLLKAGISEGEVLIESELKKRQPLKNKGKKLNQQIKHPDLLVTDSLGRNIAVEIELTSKSRSRYMVALRAYRSKSVERIVFVIRSSGTKMAIQKAANEVRFPTEEMPIGFCSLYEWQQNPFAARVFFGRNWVPFGSLLQSPQDRPAVESTSTLPRADGFSDAI